MPVCVASPAGPLSQARYLFELYTGTAAPGLLQSLPTQVPKVFETEWLDFKTGKFNPQDVPRIWSKALGAFANNEGGVVVWGVDAKKDPDTGVDAAHAVEPVADVYRLTSRLKELHHQATDPPIKGVEVTPLPLHEGSPAGFVVCFVPESGHKPHRAEHDGKKFYLRMGDSAKECSVSILRQLFYPRVSLRAEMDVEGISIPPQIGPTTFFNPDGSRTPSASEDGVRLSLRNTGEYSIHDPMLKIVCGKALLATFQFSNARDAFDLDFVEGDIHLTRVLHPGRATTWQIIVSSPAGNEGSHFEVTLFARDMTPLTAKVGFSEVRALPRKKHTRRLQLDDAAPDDRNILLPPEIASPC